MDYEECSITIPGIVVKGHGVASGKAKDNPYGQGTISLQSPYFEKLGIPMHRYHPATINLDISPHTFDLVGWDYEARRVNWTEVIPPEDFFFSHCRLIFDGRTYDTLIYRPSLETKVDHFQKPSIVEILALKIKDLTYGNKLGLQLNPDHCKIT